VLALHYTSFVYLATVAAGLSRRMGLSSDVAAATGLAVMLPYLILALKRVYAASSGAIAVKGAALILLTLLLNNLASFVAIRLTLALV
jgi:hypothetical protein